MRKFIDIFLLAALWPAGALFLVCALPAVVMGGVAFLLMTCISEEVRPESPLRR